MPLEARLDAARYRSVSERSQEGVRYPLSNHRRQRLLLEDLEAGELLLKVVRKGIFVYT